MFLIPIFILMTFSFAEAKTLKVSSSVFDYQLHATDKALKLEGSGVSLSMFERDCNRHILSQFNSELNRILERNELILKHPANEISYLWGDKKLHARKDSHLGKYLISIPMRFQQLKLEEKFNCEK